MVKDVAPAFLTEGAPRKSNGRYLIRPFPTPKF